MKTSWTTTEALDALRDLVKERGEDYRYNAPDGRRCYYTWQGEASCAIGVILHKSGVPLETLERFDAGSGVPCATVLDDLGITADVGALEAFGVFQDRQDNMHEYGAALEDATYEADRVARYGS